jgi:hypothetical protein
MLDFLWHIRGTITLDRVDLEAVTLDRVEWLLKRERKHVIERGSEYLVFNSPFWSEWPEKNWLPMMIYDGGRFWIERDLHEARLRYDLRSLRAMVFGLFFAFLTFCFGLTHDSVVGGSLAGALRYAAWAFAWLYGMNVVLALVRVPSSIRKAVAGG